MAQDSFVRNFDKCILTLRLINNSSSGKSFSIVLYDTDLPRFISQDTNKIALKI